MGSSRPPGAGRWSRRHRLISGDLAKRILLLMSFLEMDQPRTPRLLLLGLLRPPLPQILAISVFSPAEEPAVNSERSFGEASS